MKTSKLLPELMQFLHLEYFCGQKFTPGSTWAAFFWAFSQFLSFCFCNDREQQGRDWRKTVLCPVVSKQLGDKNCRIFSRIYFVCSDFYIAHVCVLKFKKCAVPEIERPKHASQDSSINFVPQFACFKQDYVTQRKWHWNPDVTSRLSRSFSTIITRSQQFQAAT